MREAANLFYQRVPDVVAEAMARFEAQTGRRYGLVDYAGAAFFHCAERRLTEGWVLGDLEALRAQIGGP